MAITIEISDDELEYAPVSTDVVTRRVGKRKRTPSQRFEDSRVHAEVKKARMDTKKKVTAANHDRKGEIELAQKRWVHAHRALFEDVLPPKNPYLASVEKEMQSKAGRGSHVPLRQLDEQPSLVTGGSLKAYQMTGVSFLAWMYDNGMNCMLGDEMGLGKTLQTLSLMAYAKEHHPHDPPHLVICPLSVLDTWVAEVARWVPSFRAVRCHGSASERAETKHKITQTPSKVDICVTTYEAYRADHQWFKRQRWNIFVLDEGHRIRHSNTEINHTIQGQGSLYRLILTGTPVHNDLKELWSLFRFLYPSIFTAASQRNFEDSFDLSRGLYEAAFTSACRRLLDRVMLRRTHAEPDIAKENAVPEREEITIRIPLGPAQRFWMYRLLTRQDTLTIGDIFQAQADGHGDDDEMKAIVQRQMQQSPKEDKTWRRLMNLLLQLRKVCNHPYMLPGAQPEPYYLGEHLVSASSKMAMIDKLLADIIGKGERALVFSQFNSMLNLIEDLMNLRGIKYCRLDGQTSRARRKLDIRLFQAEDSPYSVYLVATKAGGLGINLTRASHVIMVDRDWNPQNDLQAIARAHRIGQTKVVKVYSLICSGTVEQQMEDRINRKLFLSSKMMGSGDGAGDDHADSLKLQELLSIMRMGATALADGATTAVMPLHEFNQADARTILAAARKQEKKRRAELERGSDTPTTRTDSDVAEEEENMRRVARVFSRLFEGKLVARPVDRSKAWEQAENEKAAGVWQEIQKRARVDRLVTVDGMQFVAEQVLAPGDAASREEALRDDAPAKKPRGIQAHEPWCIVCRDGGELFCCNHCPRVVHAECISLSVREARKQPMIRCPQHRCMKCERQCSDAGGMLYRCETCPNTYCDDCLPDGKFWSVGESCPVQEALGFSRQATAYFMRCHPCQKRFKKDSNWEGWEDEIREAEEKLARMYQSN
ncbi:unnamed protein product [Peniophora sp. CBMAI 1063]|nr:unnamed protein product [Peniophora sp. CBMAI 1063]